MASYDEKIVYGRDLVPYGQKLVDKIKVNIVDNLNSNETNKFLSANQGKILNETKLGKTEKAENSKLSDVSVRLQTSRNIILTGGVSGRASFDGTADATITTTLSDIDASKITSGTIDIARLPKGALERVVVVANDEARFALTKSEVQNGDTVKVTQTLKMYFVKDDNQLSTEAGYEEYTAGKATAVDWTGIQGKPESFPPSAHNQASNTITAMTGYAKTGSGAISPSDSLNVAIGKLEVALDTKEPTISKQSGFNLSKSDAINEANSSQLATSLAVKTAYDKGMEALNRATAVEQSVGSKLDKGGYNGTANDLKGLVDRKQNAVKQFATTGTLDLNDYYLEDGTYVRSRIGSSTVLNAPHDMNTYFYLVVYSSNFFTYQLFFDGYSSNDDKFNRVYVRKRKDEHGWSEWQEILTTNTDIFLGQVGVDKKQYIQDSIIKEVGKGYIDKLTGKLYFCFKRADESVVTPSGSYFLSADNINIANRLNAVNREVTVLSDTTQSQGQTFSVNFESFRNYKYINVYAGYMKASTLYARVLISDVLERVEGVGVPVGLHGANDMIELGFLKNAVTVQYKSVTGNDIFRYIKLTASDV